MSLPEHTPSPRTIVFFVHGVNFFEPDEIDHATSINPLGLLPSECEIRIFDWDQLVGFPLTTDTVNPRYLAEIGGGLLTAANLGGAQFLSWGKPRLFFRQLPQVTFRIYAFLMLFLPPIVTGAIVAHAVS